MIPLSEIAYADNYMTAQGRSTASWVAPGIIGGGVVAIGALILIVRYLMEGFANALGHSFDNMI
jgi:CHASE1-domain containing sensor protein